ncbi:MAG TPA: lysyl oxidase family protein [Thermoleophilaceae bacterium]|nr:lysyl oxidase family protein [Thermoleophilaceae bacterium]
MRILLVSAAALAVLAVAAPAASAQKPANLCLDRNFRAALRCPDLIMRRAFGLRIDPFVHPGRVMLRAGNSIDSVGAGPAELFGVRSSRMYMKARQRIYYRRTRGKRVGIPTGARLYFKYVPRQRSYWKFLHAAQFDLYRLRANGTRGRRVRRGPKVSYCLRDLEHTRPGKARSPKGRRYPACNTSSRTRKVRLGTSVGWSDVYPPGYPEQYIDVTGLRGCFAYVHTADPRNGIYESNERNNASTVVVRLPFRGGKQRCPGPQAAKVPDTRDYDAEYRDVYP